MGDVEECAAVVLDLAEQHGVDVAALCVAVLERGGVKVEQGLRRVLRRPDGREFRAAVIATWPGSSFECWTSFRSGLYVGIDHGVGELANRGSV